MNKQQYVQAANTEPFVTIQGKTTSREFSIREFTYGALVPDYNHPLSSVSVANSSLSIDLWVGCGWQCRYCHVQGTSQDLADEGKMPKKPQRRNEFTIDEIVDALVEHPFFIRDETFISIGTASTEPFAPGEVTDSTFEVMDAFVRRGFRNPFWIVTKGGVPKGRKLDFARIVNATRGVMLSLCWADNPNIIEPAQNNRFANAEEAKEAGVTIAWYMRPIVPEWSGDTHHIEMMMLWVKKHYGSVIDMIVPGGLRWTEGIENGLVEIHDVAMPDIPRDDNVKSLPTELEDAILSLANEHFPGVPVYFKSSCALSRMLEIPNLISVQNFARRECEMSRCPLHQRQICAGGPVYDLNVERVQRIFDNLEIPAKVVSWDLKRGLVTSPSLETFTYGIRQTIFKALAKGE